MAPFRRIGSTPSNHDYCEFRVWAPLADSVDLHILPPSERIAPMAPEGGGYFFARLDGVTPGARYRYRLNGGLERADPASRFQPEGVSGPSGVVFSDFPWTDRGWAGIPLEKYILYELHTGTFSREGTFAGIIPYLDELKRLGVTAIELMPVAQFPGGRNWGYDGVFPFAAQNTYGGPRKLMALVDACHARGLAVVLDVVYNHLGPEGNYLGDFGPYFTDRYRTPWGDAVNFDGPGSDDVRAYFISNALEWVTDFHFDALRLDAVHAIYDSSAYPFLQELADAVHRRAAELNRRIYVIAESDLNDARLIRPAELGGYGLDAEWADDFHHALHALLTGERQGYYEDFGRVHDLETAFTTAHVYDGRYSPYRRRRHGNSAAGLPPSKFVVCAQNHDQIGNRRLGERMSRLVGFESLKLAAATVLLSPYIPLLFMGEEYGETAPFQYFVSHTDEELVEAVREGRRREFEAFAWRGEVPDPQSERTFLDSRLNHALKDQGQHRLLYEFYNELIGIRKRLFSTPGKRGIRTYASEPEGILLVERATSAETVLLLHFGERPVSFAFPLAGEWRVVIDSSSERWGGPRGAQPPRVLAAHSAVLLEKAGPRENTASFLPGSTSK
ncbi:MAG: malto-oligosyltrehalose trehalohydrolase [Rhodospirillales bacterium]